MATQADYDALPSVERCKEILSEANFTLPAQWTCPVCKVACTRAHWTAEHVIEHHRMLAANRAMVEAEGKRAIEID
jgi:RNA polymerase subunit RPABC4/transcription elongation factor Spt4